MRTHISEIRSPFCFKNRFDNGFSLFICEPFTGHYHNAAFLFQPIFHIFYKLFFIKRTLRKVNQIRSVSFLPGQRTGCRNPACISTGSLHHHYMNWQGTHIRTQFFRTGCNIAGCTSKTGTVVCHRNIVICSLGNPHNTDIQISGLTGFMQFPASVHRTVASIKEHIFYLSLYQNICHFFIVLLPDRVSGRSNGSSRSLQKQFQLFFRHIF